MTTSKHFTLTPLLALLIIFILGTGVAGGYIFIKTEQAWATTTETITHDQIVAQNPLLIMNTKTAKKELGISAMPKVEIVNSNQTNMIKTRLEKVSENRNVTRWSLQKYSTEIIDSLLEGTTRTGYSIQFPSCDSEGESASVTLRYPLIGQYEGRKVEALVKYTVVHQEAVETPIYSGWGGNMNYTHTVMQISDSLYAGMDICNAKSIDTEVQFFYADDKTRVTLGPNSMFTIGSLNFFDEGRFESVTVKNSDTVKIQTPDATDPQTLGNTKVSSNSTTSVAHGFRGDNWVDEIYDPSYFRQSASVFQTGNSFKFCVKTTKNVAGNGYKGNIWWSLSSASTAVPKPITPTKTVDKDHALIGETLTYTLEQKAHTTGMNIQGKYQSFAFYDTLPKEIDYIAGSARMYRVSAEGPIVDITASAGSFEYSEKNHKLSYTFKPAYLNNMLLDGETYRMKFFGIVNNKALDNELFSNTATISVNGHGQEATASTTAHYPHTPIKEVAQSEYNIGDDITWTISQTVAERGVNASAEYAYSALKLSDTLDDALAFKSIEVYDGKGSVITSTAGTHNVSDQNVTYTFNSNYLSKEMLYQGETYTFVITATLSKPPAGTSVIENQASTTFNNKHSITSNIAQFLSNTSSLSLEKTADYEHRVHDEILYTLSLTNTTEGSIAHNIIICDDSLPEDLLIQNVEISGVPAEVNYPILVEGSLSAEKRDNAPSYNVEGSALSINIPYLPYGAIATISYSVSAEEQYNGAEIVNTAYATFDNPASTAQNLVQDDAVIWINSPLPSPNKTSDQNAKRVGDTIKYIIDVVNPCVGTVARNLVIEDNFVTEGVEIDRSSIVVYDSNGDIITPHTTITQNRNVQGFKVETHRSLVNEKKYVRHASPDGLNEQSIQNPLDESSELMLSIEFNAKIVDPGLAGADIINTVSTSCDEGDGGEDEDISSVNGPVLFIDKQVSSSQALVGDTLSYHLQVKQSRESLVAHNVIIEDIIDADHARILENTVAVYDKNNEKIENCVIHIIETGMLIETHHDLSDKDILNISYDVVITASPSEGRVFNTATAWADDAGKVMDKEVITTAEPPLLKPANISVSKTADPETGSLVLVGDEITYTLSVSNTGETPAHNVAIFDKIPEHTAFVSIADIHMSTYLADKNAVAWNISEIAPEEVIELTFIVMVNDTVPAGYEIKNKASFNPETPGVPNEPLPKESNETIHITPDLKPAEVVVRKSADPESGSIVNAGDTITYTLTFLNIGEHTAYDIAVFDPVPAYTTFKSVPSNHGGVYMPDKNALAWNIPTIEPDEIVELSFSVVVDNHLPKNATIYNMATFSPNSPDIPQEPLNYNSNTTEHFQYYPNQEAGIQKNKTPKTADTTKGIFVLAAVLSTISLFVITLMSTMRYRAKKSSKN